MLAVSAERRLHMMSAESCHMLGHRCCHCESADAGCECQTQVTSAEHLQMVAVGTDHQRARITPGECARRVDPGEYQAYVRVG